MKYLGIVTACTFALGAISAAPAAYATPVTFDLSGSFGSQFAGSPLLNGSFSGTFSVTGLPIVPPNTAGSYAFLSSFDIVLRNAAKQIVMEYTSSNAGDYGYVDARYETPRNLDFPNFGGSDGSQLSLLFAPRFDGAGNILPVIKGSDGLFQDSLFYLNGTYALVASGASVDPVPEPSTTSLLLAAVGMCATTRLCLRG